MCKTPEKKWIILALLIVGVATFYPFLDVWLVINDDLKFSNAALDGGARCFASTLWLLTLKYGRLHLAKMLSYYLPFAFSNFVYFKVVTIGAVLADLVLFAYFLKKLFESEKVFYLTLLLSLAFLQNSWEHNPLVSFAGFFTFTFLYQVISWITFLRFLEKGEKKYAAVSAISYLLTLLTYEAYTVFLPIYLGMALWKGHGWKRASKSMIPLGLSLLSYLGFYLLFSLFRTSNYPGATMDRHIHPGEILNVIWQFSIAATPGYFFCNAKYRYLFGYFQGSFRPMNFWTFVHDLQGLWLIKTILVTGLFIFLTSTKEKLAQWIGWPRTWLLLLMGCYCFFAPSIPLALTEHYQRTVRVGGQLGMQSTFFSFFALVFLGLTITTALQNCPLTNWQKKVLLACFAICLVAVTLMVEYTNYYVGRMQSVASGRWRLVNALLGSPAYANIPPGSRIIAPSLFEPMGSLSFDGTAIDPPPNNSGLYANYWTFYFSHFGKKKVTVSSFSKDRILRNSDSFYLKYSQEQGTWNQCLIIAPVVSGGEESDQDPRYLSDTVWAFEDSPRLSFSLGGFIAPGLGPTSISLQRGGSIDANSCFLFDVPQSSLTKSARFIKEAELRANHPAIAVESLYVASPGIVPPLIQKYQSLIRGKGWYGDGWVAQVATVKLNVGDKHTLVLAGAIPDYVISAAPGSELRIQVKMNGSILAERSLHQAGNFDLAVELPVGWTGDLTIETNGAFVPKDHGVGGDSRRLGYLVKEIFLK